MHHLSQKVLYLFSSYITLQREKFLPRTDCTRILVYTFCLISIALSLSNEANKMKFLNIERA